MRRSSPGGRTGDESTATGAGFDEPNPQTGDDGPRCERQPIGYRMPRVPTFVASVRSDRCHEGTRRRVCRHREEHSPNAVPRVKFTGRTRAVPCLRRDVTVTWGTDQSETTV